MPTALANHSGYQAVDSFLHRFDPRLKLLLLLGTVACTFSATSPLRLGLIFLLWLAAAVASQVDLFADFKIVRMMRWLLLFALLLHLLLTPGRTLFGSRWLSFDGLLHGLLIDSQLVLAVLISLLLAHTTRPEQLAWAFARLLSPLQKLRIPVRETASLLLLVLQMFPLLQAETAALKAERPVVGIGLMARIKGLVTSVGPLLFRLVDRADQLAVEIASGAAGGDDPLAEQSRKLVGSDIGLFSGGILLLVLLWML